MGRLVDADVYCKTQCAYEGECSRSQRSACTITDTPTAYDVDKVVEQLEEFREEAKRFGVDGMLTDIIDVVKRGGVDEPFDR